MGINFAFEGLRMHGLTPPFPYVSRGAIFNSAHGQFLTLHSLLLWDVRDNDIV